MKRLLIATAVVTMTMSVCAGVSADDVSVRTSVGSGEVLFTETDESAEVSAEELTGYVKEALEGLQDMDELDLFVDASADITLKLDAENTIPITAGAIGSFDKNGSDNYTKMHYYYDLMGNSDQGDYEAYTWEEDGIRYRAKLGSKGWRVSASQKYDDFDNVTSGITSGLESDDADSFVLSGLQPNMYEFDGDKFYVCLIDTSEILDTANEVEAAAAYTDMFGSALEGISAKIVLVIDAETCLPRAISFDASNASGSFPGTMLGAEGDLGFTANDLYATMILVDDAGEIEIPEEVVNTPLTDEE